MLAVGAAAPAWAQAGDTVRPPVGKPLQAAQDLIRQGKFAAALAKVRDADAIRDKTAYESYVVEQLRGVAAQGAGDNATAIKSFEAVIASERTAPAERLKMIQAVADMSYRQKDYPTTIEYLNRYFKEGGGDPQMRTLLAQTYYLNNDFANAAKLLREQVAATEKSGGKPAEDQLQLLANCVLKQNDIAGYTATIEKLVQYYPKRDYWLDLIHRTQKKPGFADRLTLDVERLELATGVATSAPEYMEATQLALQDHVPGEAKAISDKGFASGVLGVGPEADRQKRLRGLVDKQTADDRAAIAKDEAEAAAAKDGVALVAVGFDYVGYGQFDKGLPLIEQGIRKGGLKHPEDAKLHLAIAYHLAGQKAKAVQMFKTVQGADGAADLARLWLLYVNQAPAA